MVWLTLGLMTLLGLLLVWIATQENRSARILGASAVLVHTLTLIGGLGLEPTSIWILVAGVIGVAHRLLCSASSLCGFPLDRAASVESSVV